MTVLEDPLNPTAAFDEFESSVRSYCRGWPTLFDRAQGSWIFAESGRPYLDFFAGAGALNYGHNNPVLKRALADYLASDRVVHSLDMYTTAKRDFLVAFDEIVLGPRGLDYRVQFPGPAGNNAVEAALKLVRKLTARTDVIAFTGAFHGVTLGALALTANPHHRRAAGLPLEHVIRLPYDDPATDQRPDFTLLDAVLADASERPAGVIVETVQGEGGVNPARLEWLRGLSERCRATDVPLIVDDVQMGCGRTGPFFSFELAGITPDIVCVSKAISGYGFPLALTLIRRDLDVWEPGEHNGTFRGFNPALITASAALHTYWRDDTLERRTMERGRWISQRLSEIAARASLPAATRGRGMINGLAFEDGETAGRVAACAFERGLLVECCGSDDEVVKLLPPLTASDAELEHGLSILAEAIERAC